MGRGCRRRSSFVLDFHLHRMIGRDSTSLLKFFVVTIRGVVTRVILLRGKGETESPWVLIRVALRSTSKV